MFFSANAVAKVTMLSLSETEIKALETGRRELTKPISPSE
jgi:hypothetical protein